MLDFSLADVIVLLAGVSFFIGYLITHQITLRIAVLIGTGFYIWYYAVVDETPLWVAIWTSLAMGFANIIGLCSLFLRNSPLSIPARHRDIYGHFKVLPPGDFRKLMRAAKRVSVPKGIVLTTDGAPVKTVYFILQGPVAVDKFGERFNLPDGIFLGEVGYLTGKPASATTMMTDEGVVLEWDVATLKRKSRKDARFRLAMDAVMSLDLANKVARAGAPQSKEQKPQLLKSTG